MKIYNENKTKEFSLEECNLELGYLITRNEIVYHQKIEPIEEQGHYETIKEYENGGKDVEWIVDVPGIEGQEAWEEEIPYQIYIPYTEEYIREKQINEEIKMYKQLLFDSDYKAIKYAEGYYTEEEYNPIRYERQSYRNRINKLEEELNILKEEDYSV